MTVLRTTGIAVLLLGLQLLVGAAPPTPFTPEKFGIGATIVHPDSAHYFIVKGTFPHGPADRAGVAAGDTLLEIDGQSVASWSFAKLLDYILRDEPLPITL